MRREATASLSKAEGLTCVAQPGSGDDLRARLTRLEPCIRAARLAPGLDERQALGRGPRLGKWVG